MFDFVQENKRFVYIVLALIILPFAFFGLDSYRHSVSVEAPATVDGVKITAQDFETSLNAQKEQLRQRLGANFDPAMFDTPELRRAVMDNLVSQRLMVEKAKSSGLTVTDDMVAQVIASVEAFKVNGKFDQKRYELLLSNNGLSPLMYEARVRDELVRQQMNDAYVQNGYAANVSVEKAIALNEQQRVVSIANVSLQDLMAKVKVSDADIKKYYDDNAKEFAVPEQARVEYVVFSANRLSAKTDVASEDVRKYYDEHQAEFGRAEERQAAHILIGVAATAAQAEQDAAKAKAEKVLAEVKQNPAKFAELAKQYSQDPGSAQRGGDLGMFGHGMMVKPFEEAVFSMKVGDISALVKSDFGYHIIKLTAVKPARALPFDEVRESILAKLRQQKSGEKFSELAEKFSNTVYEQSDTLKPAADLAGGKIEQSPWLIKGSPNGELWNAKSLQAIFSDDVLKNKRNTAAVEVAPSTLVAARLLEYKPAGVKPLGEVQATIQQKLQRIQAAQLASQQGQAALAELQKSGKTELKWGNTQTLSRSQRSELEASLLVQVFQADAAKLPQYVGAESSQGGYVIARVEAVKAGAQPDDAKRAGYTRQLRQMLGEEMFQAYLTDAKSHAKIKINMPDVVKAKVE